MNPENTSAKVKYWYFRECAELKLCTNFVCRRTKDDLYIYKIFTESYIH